MSCDENHRAVTRHGVSVRIAFVLCATLVPCVSGGFPGDDARGRHPNPLERDAAVPPSIQALAMTDAGTLYAGSFGFGMFVSHDRGETWESINAGLDDRFILCVSTDRNGTVYAGTVRGGVFRTLEDGNTWEPVKAGLRAVEVKALLAGHGTMYAGTGNGVYRFDEAARHWVVVATGLEQTLVTSLVMTDDLHVFAGTAGRGVYRIDTATPGAVQWNKVDDQLVDPKEYLPQTYIRVMALSPNQHMYAGTFDGGVYRSRDAGKTWRPLGRSLPNDSIRGIVITKTALYAATGRGIFKHDFRNAEWVSVNNGLTELSVQVLIGSSRGDLYAGTSAGAFRSQDAGGHWVNIGENLGRYRSMPRPY